MRFLKHYMVVASLHLKEIILDEQGGVIDAAYQNFGVLADAEEGARALVCGAVGDAVIDWGDSEIRQMRETELGDPRFAKGRTALANSIWFVSGRIFYPSSVRE